MTLAFLKVQADECPDLAGTYICPDPDEGEFELVLEQKFEEENWKYFVPLIENFEEKPGWVTANDKQYGDDNNYVRAACKEQLLSVTQFVKQEEDGFALILRAESQYGRVSETQLSFDAKFELSFDGEKETGTFKGICEKKQNQWRRPSYERRRKKA